MVCQSSGTQGYGVKHEEWLRSRKFDSASDCHSIRNASAKLSSALLIGQYDTAILQGSQQIAVSPSCQISKRVPYSSWYYLVILTLTTNNCYVILTMRIRMHCEMSIRSSFTESDNIAPTTLNITTHLHYFLGMYIGGVQVRGNEETKAKYTGRAWSRSWRQVSVFIWICSPFSIYNFCGDALFVGYKLAGWSIGCLYGFSGNNGKYLLWRRIPTCN